MATKRRTTNKTKAPPTVPAVTNLAPDNDATHNRTIGEAIIESVERGVDPITAAQLVGVSPQELTAWTREGVLQYNRYVAGHDWTKDFTPEQQDLVLFQQQLTRAIARSNARAAVDLERLARGGFDSVTVREKVDSRGRLLERVRTSETKAPDLAAITFKLERLNREVYGPEATLNVNVTDLTDTEAVADILEQRMHEVAERLRGVIDTTATETPATDEGDDDDAS